MFQKNKLSAQGEIEYIMTYGWALVVLLTILTSMYYLGIFNLNQNIIPQTSGFLKIKPVEQKIFLTANGYFTGTFTNQAGYVIDISNVEVLNILENISCSDVTWYGDYRPGGMILIQAYNCVSEGGANNGESYALKMRITYESNIAGEKIQKIDEGNIYGIYIESEQISFTCTEQGGYCCGGTFDTCKSGTRILASDCDLCCRGTDNSNCVEISGITSTTTITTSTSTTLIMTTTSITTTLPSSSTSTTPIMTTTTSTVTVCGASGEGFCMQGSVIDCTTYCINHNFDVGRCISGSCSMYTQPCCCKCILYIPP